MKRLIGWIIGLGLSLTLAATGSYTWYWYQMSTPVADADDVVRVVVDEGASWDHAAELLLYQGLVDDPILFELRARQRNKRVPLKAGEYLMRRSMTPDELMDKLAAGPDTLLSNMPLRFQIIEGDNVFVADSKLEGLGPAGLLKLAADPKRVKLMGLPTPDTLPTGAHTLLEGYLFPDTYFLNRKKPKLKTAVTAATRRFNAVWAQLSAKNAASKARLKSQLNLSDHDIVIVASLIQKEVQALQEAPLIAGVFYNRLKAGQRLQTDPTLVYSPGTWREVPRPRHRRDTSNPYNTYHHKGLPPGPICNPGQVALDAAMAPAKTEALYFVAMRDGTGRHVFSKTHAEHKANIEKYLKR